MAGVLTDKAILVTGASTGIGRATALRAAQEGARVMVADVNTVEGPNTVEAINEAGGKAVFIETDVTQSDQVRAAIAATVEHFGSLDGAFNNAGIEGVFTNITRLSEEDYDRTMAVNAKGVWLCVKYEIEQMLQSGGGSIVSTASVAGIAGTRGASAYAAAKHALHGYFDCARVELGDKGIHFTLACPGFVSTQVSANALTANGQPFGGVDPDIARGMPPAVCAERIWRAVERNRLEVTIAGKETIAVYLKRFLPLSWYTAFARRLKVH